jgi:polyhydroxyalkanoate synthesis regulator phasin
MNLLNRIKKALRAVADRLRSWVAIEVVDFIEASSMLDDEIRDQVIKTLDNSNRIKRTIEDVLGDYTFVSDDECKDFCEEAIDEYDFSDTINEFLFEREYTDYDKVLEMLDSHDFTTALTNSPGLEDLIDQRMEDRASELVIDAVCDHTQRLEERIEKLEATLKALGVVLNA